MIRHTLTSRETVSPATVSNVWKTWDANRCLLSCSNLVDWDQLRRATTDEKTQVLTNRLTYP